MPPPTDQYEPRETNLQAPGYEEEVPPTASAPTPTNPGANTPPPDEDYNCGDLTQEQAQYIYEQDPSNPYGLNGPVGEEPSGEPGVACED